MNDLYVVEGVIPKETCKVIARSFRITRDIVLYPNHDNKIRGDDIVENSFSWYSPLCMEALADVIVKDVIEDILKEKVYNSYSYGRVSYKGAILPKHRDRAASDYAVSMLIDSDREWPIYFNNGEEHQVVQKPGDMVIYNGNTMEHWREPYEGTEYLSAFMFYVKDKIRELEGRPLQGMPFNPQHDPNTIEHTLKNFRDAHGVTDP
tara:strand:- start:427 stop:1044 length:618 start_codon:yes stop_codon:yes gene_type:complete